MLKGKIIPGRPHSAVAPIDLNKYQCCYLDGCEGRWKQVETKFPIRGTIVVQCQDCGLLAYAKKPKGKVLARQFSDSRYREYAAIRAEILRRLEAGKAAQIEATAAWDELRKYLATEDGWNLADGIEALGKTLHDLRINAAAVSQPLSPEQLQVKAREWKAQWMLDRESLRRPGELLADWRERELAAFAGSLTPAGVMAPRIQHHVSCSALSNTEIGSLGCICDIVVKTSPAVRVGPRCPTCGTDKVGIDVASWPIRVWCEMDKSHDRYCIFLTEFAQFFSAAPQEGGK